MTNFPNFFVVGAAKSGTTSLYHYLKQHPEILLPLQKENFFFAGIEKNTFTEIGSFYGRNIIENWEDYICLFKNANEEKAVGEICVAYLYFYENSIKNMEKYLVQSPQIIIILRNPVDRAFSNYKHHVRDGIEPLDFDEAIKREVLRKRKNEKWWWGFEYVDVGFYYNQVKAYIDAFGAEKVKIYLYEDIEENLLKTIRDIFRFLEVDDSFTPEVSNIYNSTATPKYKTLQRFFFDYHHPLKRITRPLFLSIIGKEKTEELVNFFKNKNLIKMKMNQKTRKYLIDFYRDDILMLENLIKRDLSGWLR
jgi:hypothetical protein